MIDTEHEIQHEPKPAPAASPVDRRGPPSILSVGSGKGGVGKSFFVANLGVTLASLGCRVILVDLDLEGANLHTFLGMTSPQRSLADFVAHREAELGKLVLDTDIPNLGLIAGTDAHLEAPQPSRLERSRLIRGLSALPADVVLLDLGTGVRSTVIDYFLAGGDGVLLLDAEPTAVENAYRFMRAAYYRKMQLAMTTHPVRELVASVMDQRNERGIRTPQDLLLEVERLDPGEGARFVEAMRAFKPQIVVNRVRTAEEIKLGFSVRAVCGKYFGISSDYLGYINADPAVGRSVMQRQPVVSSEPRSDAAVYLSRIAHKLASRLAHARVEARKVEGAAT